MASVRLSVAERKQFPRWLQSQLSTIYALQTTDTSHQKLDLKGHTKCTKIIIKPLNLWFDFTRKPEQLGIKLLNYSIHNLVCDGIIFNDQFIVNLLLCRS